MIAILVLALAALAESQFRDFAAPAFAPAAPAFAPAAPAFAPAAPAFAPAFAPSFAAPKPAITVLQRIYQSDDHGQYSSSVSQSDGASFQESGELHPTNDHKDNVVVKKGSFSYTSPEGVPVHITYVADEYGFRPQGAAIPTAAHHQAPAFV